MTETATASDAIVVVDESGTALSTEPLDNLQPELQPDAEMAQLADLGIILPLGQPAALRRAFAYKQRIYAAILDPNDYLYIVPYEEGSKKRQSVFAIRADAEKFASLKGISTINAKPKKSGIVKLARALGIQAKCILREGLPGDPTANYSYCVYEAFHERTGFREEGVGWCDRSEKGGYISTHDIIATADTRAYNRAVLRLSGFGDISADEIVPGASYADEPLVDNVPEAQQYKKMEALPPPDDDNVITAARIWAEAVSKREGEPYLPEAQQNNKAYRELRAQARRGNASAAQKMGVLGVRWHGTAQDGTGVMPFPVDMPPVKPEDLAAVNAAASETDGASTDNGKSSGSVDLRDAAPVAKDSPAPAPTSSSATPPVAIPQPDMRAETITTAQARSLSQLLFKLFDNSKPAARDWIQTHCFVNGSTSVRTNQFGPIMAALTKLTEQKEATSG